MMGFLATFFCTLFVLMFVNALLKWVARRQIGGLCDDFREKMQCLYSVGKRDGHIAALRALRETGNEHALELSDIDGMEMITADSKTAHEQTREEFNRTNGIDDA